MLFNGLGIYLVCSEFILFRDVIHALTHYGAHVVVGEGVKHTSPVAAAFDKLCLLEYLKLVRHRGHGHIQRRCKVAHAHFRLEENE